MSYEFLVETYETERIKVVSVWSEFQDADLPVRPRLGDPRGRSVHEQMVHQCVSEDLWFRNMLGIDGHRNHRATGGTGGLMQNHAPTIYAYPSLQALFDGEMDGGAKVPLPGGGGKAVTERPSDQV